MDTDSDRTATLERLFEWFVHSAANGRKVLSSVPPLIDVGEPATVVSPTKLESREQAMAWFDVERPSLVAAVRLAADLDSMRATFHLAIMTWGYLLRRRAFDDMLRLLSLACDASDRMDDLLFRGQVANLLGITYGELLDNERSAKYFRQAVELFEGVGHDVGQERAMTNLGVVLLRSDMVEATVVLEQAIEFSRRLHDERTLVNPLYNLAGAYRQLERPRRPAAKRSTSPAGRTRTTTRSRPEWRR